jgi:hypothetical protein
MTIRAANGWPPGAEISVDDLQSYLLSIVHAKILLPIRAP